MENLTFNIANYRVKFWTNDSTIKFFTDNITAGFLDIDISNSFDTEIEFVKSTDNNIESFSKVFTTGYHNERIQDSQLFPEWFISKKNDQTFIICNVNHNEFNYLAIELKSSNKWTAHILTNNRNQILINPLTYPAGSLILYYLCVLHNDIMIHASGVSFDGIGRIFSGVSGIGKTTMARIWKHHGAHVISDDRLIIKKQAGEYFMHNTPIHQGDVPKYAKLNEIHLIYQSKQNTAKRIHGTEAITSVMASCIQQAHNETHINSLLNFLTNFCSDLKVFRLGFYPDNAVIDYIKSLN